MNKGDFIFHGYIIAKETFLLRYGAASLCIWLPTFRDIILVSFSRDHCCVISKVREALTQWRGFVFQMTDTSYCPQTIQCITTLKWSFVVFDWQSMLHLLTQYNAQPFHIIPRRSIIFWLSECTVYIIQNHKSATYINLQYFIFVNCCYYNYYYMLYVCWSG